MTINEAVEVLKRTAKMWRSFPDGDDREETASDDEIIAALAALDGMNIYASKYTVGDTMFAVIGKNVWEDRVREVSFALPPGTIYITGNSTGEWFESDIFRTREDAQAEADRRNQK